MDTARPVSEQASGRYAYAAESATATVSPQGLVTGWSEGARRLLGYDAPEVVGRPAGELLDAYDVRDGRWERGGHATAVLRHREGHLVRLTLRWSPSLGAEGEVRAYVVTAAEAGAGRPMVEWSHRQSPLAMATFTRGPDGWRLDPALSGDPPGEAAEEGFLRLVQQVADEERPMRYERTTPGPFSSRQQAWITEMWPVREPATGEVCGVGTATFDSSEEHWARQRLALLNEAGSRIGSTLNVTRTAQELADLAVPRLADFVSVDLLDSVLRGQEPAPGPLPTTVALRRAAHQSTHEGVPEAAVPLGGLDSYPRTPRPRGR